jgi:hypothetical protein
MNFLDKIDITEFFIKQKVIMGDMCTLICPIAFPKWTPENLMYRSSIWNQAGEPVSLSFKKFFNEGEAPELYPNPLDFKDWKAIEKIDGSALIVSDYRGEKIFRTRGTFDARGMEKNGHEIDLLIEKYPKAFNPILIGNVTLIYEWVSPLNKIVIQYNEPDIYLVGAIDHNNYSLYHQHTLDFWAKQWGVKRPQIFEFKTIKEASETVKQFQGKEGIVLYYNDDQNMIKMKGDWYLLRHKLKSELSSFEKLVDYYFQMDCPRYDEFHKSIGEFLDFETANSMRGDISRIVDGMREVGKIETGMYNFINDKVLFLPTRKEQALKIKDAYGDTNRASYLFCLLDDHPLDAEQKKKLLFQVLKYKK